MAELEQKRYELSYQKLTVQSLVKNLDAKGSECPVEVPGTSIFHHRVITTSPHPLYSAVSSSPASSSLAATRSCDYALAGQSP